MGKGVIDENGRLRRVSRAAASAHIRTDAEFSAVRTGGRAYQRRFVAMKILLTNGLTTRFGYVTGKRVGNAVVRNRVRRRLREIVRREFRGVDLGWDIVFSARESASTATFAELRESVLGMAAQSGITSAPPSAGQ